MCFRRNVILGIIFSVVLFVYYITNFKTVTLYKFYYNYAKSNSTLICHFLDTYDSLTNIQDTKIVEDTSIFFVETSCKSYDNGHLIINPRQACAVESAALLNPNRMIYFLYFSPDSQSTESSRILRMLQSYSNIKFLHVNMDKFVEGSPVDNFWKSRKIHTGKYPLSHSSDVIRYLLLWKYGGIYADLDVVVVKNLDTLPENFAGAEDQRNLNSGVMGFSKHGIGHKHVESCLYDIAEHYDGNTWGTIGPFVVTKLAKRLCNTPHIKNITGKSCQDFHILPIDAFYPIHYHSWSVLFDKNELNFVRNKSSSSYMLHLWNKLSFNHSIDIPNDDVPYLYFAKKYCPRTITNVMKYF
ncbi:lactosylceramide 4-alpha-galactosyltransferase-like isoform X2 [Rhynchophorus ferrugineus]|uniref:lactosylceramide 4-alpha-galactosyltransferase-like isoform X2 n=1 Tax=Rhynchophorus ferrugineus TaxID=354439 RepID=UPI003FCE8A81